MKVIVKKAAPKDLKDVQALNLLLFKKEYKDFDSTLNCEWTFSKKGRVYYKKRITKNDGCLFIAKVDKKVVGYLAGGIQEKNPCRIVPQIAELENMFVLDEYRNMKIGTRLYKLFFRWAKSKKIKRVRVVASAQNAKAINFYKRQGFRDYDLALEANI